MIVEVDTGNEYLSNALKFDPNGNVLKLWDMSTIVSNAIKRLGRDPSAFVPPSTSTGQDWFHMNATAYWSYNNHDYLLVSSRESGVFAVTYDVPSASSVDPLCPSTPGLQVQNLCWVLGDTTKNWYNYLSAYSLSLGPDTINSTYAPIGQHGISINSVGNLLLMNDGLQSLYQPYQGSPGINRNYSFVNTFQLNPGQAAGPRAVPEASYFPYPAIYSGICGSVYDFKGAHLVDFANVGQFNAPIGSQPTTAVLQVLGPYNGSSSKFVVNIVYQNPSNPLGNPPYTACVAGWNAVPIDLSHVLLN